MKMNDKLSEIFDLEPIEYKQLTPSQTDIVPQDAKEEYIDNDYEYVRGNVKDLLETGKDALLDMIEVAKQSEHPRAYEVVGGLLKQLSDMNQQLMDIHHQKQKLSGVKEKEQTVGNVTNNNAIFVGSTNDLATMIKNMNKGE